MLKTDLHLHTGYDSMHRIYYTPKDLIRRAAKLNYDVLSITHHLKVYYPKYLVDYAKKLGILLIPGCEHRIQDKDVLIYNITEEERKKIKTFDDLAKFKKKNKSALVVAPHPFYIPHSLNKLLIQNIELFDAIEFCHFYTKFHSKNKKAIKSALKYDKTLIANSDSHHFIQFNKNYSLVDAKKTNTSVINAIKKSKVVIRTKPLSFSEYFIILYSLVSDIIKRPFIKPMKPV